MLFEFAVWGGYELRLRGEYMYTLKVVGLLVVITTENADIKCGGMTLSSFKLCYHTYAMLHSPSPSIELTELQASLPP